MPNRILPLLKQRCESFVNEMIIETLNAEKMGVENKEVTGTRTTKIRLRGHFMSELDKNPVPENRKRLGKKKLEKNELD